jgi:hypothetical protein
MLLRTNNKYLILDCGPHGSDCESTSSEIYRRVFRGERERDFSHEHIASIFRVGKGGDKFICNVAPSLTYTTSKPGTFYSKSILTCKRLKTNRLLNLQTA